MGERAKIIVDEYVALELLKRNDFDIDKFYSGDLKIFVKTAKKEIDKLSDIINKSIKLTTNLLNTEKQGYYQIIFKEQLKVLNGDKNVN